jgi:hypothetical protein
LDVQPPAFARLIGDDLLRRGFYERHFRLLKAMNQEDAALKWRQELPEADRPAVEEE